MNEAYQIFENKLIIALGFDGFSQDKARIFWENNRTRYPKDYPTDLVIAFLLWAEPCSGSSFD